MDFELDGVSIEASPFGILEGLFEGGELGFIDGAEIFESVDFVGVSVEVVDAVDRLSCFAALFNLPPKVG